MTPEVFGEWLRRQGNMVVCSGDDVWFELGGRVLQHFPTHLEIDPADGTAADVLKRSRALALRYCASPSSLCGMPSYYVGFRQERYGYECLGHRTRKNVRKGLRHASVRPISFEDLADKGWALFEDTLARQRRGLTRTRQQWAQRCRTAADLLGFEAWGAFIQGELAGSLLTFSMPDCCYLVQQQSRSDALALNVNNALTFTVMSELSERSPGALFVYGLGSLDAGPGVDEFKFHMGFEAVPVKQRVIFHPAIPPAVLHAGHLIVRGLAARRRTSGSLNKVEGLLRFALASGEGQAQEQAPAPERKTSGSPAGS